ncbi:hypothetical protein ACFQDD_00965 [Halorubrum pallidum]|uniref:Halobacterial output domain-containing protein n=1 Tax=Halorubrum pallidum TaxID=1526114 RepID=A0ABD5SZ12_9EURY
MTNPDNPNNLADLPELVDDYTDSHAGDETDIESVTFPMPDEPWFDILVWLLNRVDEGTIKRQEMAGADGAYVELTDLTTDNPQLRLHQDGSSVALATKEATETGQALSIVDTAEKIQIQYSDGTTLVSVSKTADNGEDITNEAINDPGTFPTAPLIDASVSEIKNSSLDFPEGGFVYSTVDEEFVINDTTK